MAGTLNVGKGGESQSYLLVASTNTVETGRKQKEKFRNAEGMGWLVTALFIVGETAGGGLIAMPTAMVSAGLWGGIAIILIGAIMCTYTGVQLSQNWNILQSRWPEYRHHCRMPYPAMGLRAIGPNFARFVSACLDVTQFGTAVVFILLAAKNIENFLHAGGIQIGFCYIVLIVAAFMLPFTMLKSPKDFWWAVIGAMITTTIAVTLIIVGSARDFPACAHHVHYPPMNMNKIFMTFGTVMFAYGGHGAFPTIQHDMKSPFRFTRSVSVAFTLICAMYIPVSVMGYLSYGDSLLDSIIPSLQDVYIQQGVNILITLHVVLALTIVFNPLNQELEELLNVPQEFGYQRVLSRTGMMIAVVFVAETVPNFGVLLDLVGGSTITLMALIFPVIFNLYLVAGDKKYNGAEADENEPKVTMSEIVHHTPKTQLIFNIIVLLFGLVGGMAATVSAVKAMINSEFSEPCYAGIFSSSIATPEYAQAAVQHVGKFNCCGMFKNISRFGAEMCLDPHAIIASGSHG